MGLIKCPDCGKEVSENASSCIHCGAPLSGKGGTERDVKKGSQRAKFARELGSGAAFLGIIIGILLGIVTSSFTVGVIAVIVALIVGIYVQNK
jgi:uncharacterized membrane protein YvbJ